MSRQVSREDMSLPDWPFLNAHRLKISKSLGLITGRLVKSFSIVRLPFFFFNVPGGGTIFTSQVAATCSRVY